MNWIKENLRDLLITITVIFAVFYVAVFSGVWSDRNYKSDFWPDFFLYSGIAVGVLLLIGWIYLWNKTGKK